MTRLLILALFCFNVYAHEVEFSKPLIRVYKPDGRLLGNYTDLIDAAQDMQENGPMEYRIERPSFSYTVIGDLVVEPTLPEIPPETPPTAIGCSLTLTPEDNINLSFGLINTGETLCLDDGKYAQMVDVPIGKNISAVNRGMAEIDGESTLGIQWDGGLLNLTGDSIADGLKVHHASTNADTCFVSGDNNTLRNMSCSHGGSHKHKIPLKLTGSNHLIENSWFYGEGRYAVQCFGGSGMTIRNNVARWDSTIAGEPGEPNATYAIYACSDMSVEGNISLDYGIPETRMRFGGDFYMPAHNGKGLVPNSNQFIGNVAFNHAIDTDNRRGIRLDPDMPVSGTVIDNFTVNGADRGFMISSTAQNTQIGSCKLTDVTTAGATCTHSDTTLPTIINQDLIKSDMCAANERQSDWCLTSKSLIEYMLNL